ncbi:serine/threonine-protein kinase [Thermoactinospora rubra]|uniref:serine/threonine-protein kinase n=1 Tax=Thermoactinospora rubra TaxID=1088767 RepID=UPI000A0FE789|nr:serine/threonine-protein kinase [Thermoactinospora rubra]
MGGELGEGTAAVGQHSPLTPEDPTAIGPYQLVGRLGSGGMGTVYLATAPDGAQVALKAIRRDLAADPVYRARFHEEVSNARRVASFCTARVLDHGEDAGILYLVTEYIDGVSLEDHLLRHGPLSHSMLHSVGVGVAAALTAIHAAGLVHRDLKPANVMLTLAGPRVIDFGLARSATMNSRHTNVGMVMGTPGWIAPEQVFEGRTSPAADVFAWGSLIAYAGLGGHPFGQGDAYVMAARARTAPPDLRGLPAPLDRLVAAAIHPDPDRRPTATQLLLELVGATETTGAQQAATRFLTDSWDPAAFPRPVPPRGSSWSPHPQGHTGRPPRPAAPPPPGPPGGGPGHVPHPPASRGPLPHPEHTGTGRLPHPSAPPPEVTGGGRLPHPSAPPPDVTGGGRMPRPSAPPPDVTGSGRMPRPSSPPPDVTGTGRLPHPPAPGRSGGGPPPPGHPPQPVRPLPQARGGLGGGCLALVVVGVLLLVLLVVLISSLLRSPSVSAEDVARDGKLSFAVTKASCPKPARSASARTCTISLRVRNVGQESRVLYPGQQKIVDTGGVAHPGTRLLDKSGKALTPVRVPPGQSFTGALVFELPRATRPEALELHDSALSRGVRVRLP